MTAITTPSTTVRRRAAVTGIAAAVLAVGIAGASFQASGAWFTAEKVATGNSVTAGTLALGELGDAPGGLIQAADAYPMTDAQAVEATSAAPQTVIKVRNTGSLPLKGTVTLTGGTIAKAAGNTAAGTPAVTGVKVSVWNPATSSWTAPIAWNATSISALAPLKDITVEAGATHEIKLRVFFDQNGGNEYQGAKFSFNAAANAIQTNRV